MKLLLCLGFALGVIAIASTLTCKICKFRVFSICITSSSTETCTGNCSLTTANLGKVSLFRKQACQPNCQATNGTQSENIFGFEYNVACCNTDQCNNANSIKISFSLGLGIVLLWLLNAV